MKHREILTSSADVRMASVIVARPGSYDPPNLRQFDSLTDHTLALHRSFLLALFECKTDVIDNLTAHSRIVLSHDGQPSISSIPPQSRPTNNSLSTLLCLPLFAKARAVLRLDIEPRHLQGMHLNRFRQVTQRAHLPRRWVSACGGQMILGQAMGAKDLIPHCPEVMKIRAGMLNFLGARWMPSRR